MKASYKIHWTTRDKKNSKFRFPGISSFEQNTILGQNQIAGSDLILHYKFKHHTKDSTVLGGSDVKWGLTFQSTTTILYCLVNKQILKP